MTHELCTPWSLHFDRDGTEDFGIICDAEGNDALREILEREGYPTYRGKTNLGLGRMSTQFKIQNEI